MESVRYPWIPKIPKRKYWGSQIEAPIPFFFFYIQIVYAKKATVRKWKQNKIAKNDFKTAQNVTQIALFLCIFIGIPWIKGYIRTRNVYCNWLAKSMLYEYISKWFLTGHPANTELGYQGKAVPQEQALALSFPLHASIYESGNIV